MHEDAKAALDDGISLPSLAVATRRDLASNAQY